jgi:hypothetical protein
MSNDQINIEVYCIKNLQTKFKKIYFDKGKKYEAATFKFLGYYFVGVYSDNHDTYGENFEKIKGSDVNDMGKPIPYMWDYFEPAIIRDRKDKLNKLTNEEY